VRVHPRCWRVTQKLLRDNMMQLHALSVLCALCVCQLACAFAFLGAPIAPVSVKDNVQQGALMSAREPSTTTPVVALHKRVQAGGLAAVGALASAQIALADVIDTDEVNSLSVDVLSLTARPLPSHYVNVVSKSLAT
jgi:endonuclease/exonuclease/phosphatase (EEP) superfamily protein YafD